MESEVPVVSQRSCTDDKASLAIRVEVQGGEGGDKDIEKKDNML